MKKSLTLVVFCCVTIVSRACPFCNRQIRDGIYNSMFYPNLLSMLSAFIVLAVIVIALIVISTKRHRKKLSSSTGIELLSPVPLMAAATVTGIGLGGFVDGILLHQVLQVHEMLSNKIAASNYVGKSINMFWDGIFHAFCFLVVFTGIIMLWKLFPRKDIDISGKVFYGGLLMGWALFNIVEGVIDHQILKLHNVVELSANHSIANYSFLVVSILMLITGYALATNKK